MSGRTFEVEMFVIILPIFLGVHSIIVGVFGLGRFFHLLSKTCYSSIPAMLTGLPAGLKWEQ